MKKQTLAYILGVLTYIILVSPFLLPESIIYEKHSEPIFNPYIEWILSASITIIYIFSIQGLINFWEFILKNTKD